MPVERLDHGGTMITGNAVLGVRFTMVVAAIKMHLETNGRFRMTRVATPANLRAIATEFTGRTYARSRKGLETALADLLALQAGKDLDQLGEVAKVNREVGGIAADLGDDQC